MALAELQQWGIVDRAVQSGERKRHFKAETDVWGIVRRIIRERELRLVGRSVRGSPRRSPCSRRASSNTPTTPRRPSCSARLRGLLGLSRIGYRLVESFAEQGLFTLDPIRGALKEQDGA